MEGQDSVFSICMKVLKENRLETTVLDTTEMIFCFCVQLSTVWTDLRQGYAIQEDKCVKKYFFMDYLLTSH